MACILCPRATKLPGNPGERGGGACPGSGAKIHHVPTETPTGFTTTWPLTPLTCYLTTSTQRETDPFDPLKTSDLIRDWSRSWACLHPPHVYPNIQYTRTQMHTLSQDAYKPRPPPPQPPSTHPPPEERIRGFWKRQERLQGVWSGSWLDM